MKRLRRRAQVAGVVGRGLRASHFEDLLPVNPEPLTVDNGRTAAYG